MEMTQLYESTILALGAMALLMFAQLIFADMVGIKSKHPPGGLVPTDHKNLLFRATRTVANTNESVVIFVLAAFFCILSSASPNFTAYGSWGFVAARLLYAVCYYNNLQVLRSVIFGISLLFILALLLIGLAVWV